MAVIKGSAFLWHQVRFMMAVLFMIGKKQEPNTVIQQLFDTKVLTEKPNFDFAEGNNLILSDCGFEGIEWKNSSFYSQLHTYEVIKDMLETASIDQCLLKTLQQHFIQKLVKTSFIEPNCRGEIKIIPGSCISNERPNEKNKWQDVVKSIKVTKKSDRKRDDILSQLKKKYKDHPNRDKLTYMTPIQLAYFDAQNKV